MPNIKFCGFTDYNNLKQILELKPDYIGLNCVLESLRFIDFDKFKLFSELVQSRGCKVVGVFRNESIESLLKYLPHLDIIQLHGDEGIEYIEELGKTIDQVQLKNERITSQAEDDDKIEIWKAFFTPSFRGKAEESVAQNIIKVSKYVDKILLDVPKTTDLSSGIGTQNNFELYSSLVENSKCVILAGGINPENIEFYKEKYKPKIIDIASGVENSIAGIKDFIKCEKILEKDFN